jgi:hypothetical protein
MRFREMLASDYLGWRLVRPATTFYISGMDDTVDIVWQLSRNKRWSDLRLGGLRIDGLKGRTNKKTAQLFKAVRFKSRT